MSVHSRRMPIAGSHRRSAGVESAGAAHAGLRRPGPGGGPQRRTTRALSSNGAVQQHQPRGVLILPGLGNNAGDYATLSQSLSARGYTVSTVPITRPDWSRNALALREPAWWRGQLKPRPAVDWYLTRVDSAMQDLKRAVDGAPITVLTHSAGGWLGRTYLLDWGAEGVDSFVSLGSPHLAPPEGVIDQTRGILTWINDASPGAYHPNVKYTTVAGRFVKGVDPLRGEGRFLAKFAGAGYQQVCGQADVWGDFIVPVAAAHLPGATNLDLDDVFHSPLGEKLSFFGPWYGSETVLPLWEAALDGGNSGERNVSPLPASKEVVQLPAATSPSGGQSTAP